MGAFFFPLFWESFQIGAGGVILKTQYYAA